MSAPVEIQVADPTRGSDLCESLHRQGFPAELVHDGDGWRIEVTSPREDRSRLVEDLQEAIERWLPDPELRSQIGPLS
jgi:hypothetical protein